MTASYITLILDEADPSGSLITSGAASVAASQRIPDPDGQMIVGTAPLVRLFRPGSSPKLILVANDSVGPQQDSGDPGWSYTITYSPDTPGAPAAWSFWVLATGGAVQRLSQLAATPVVQPGQRYVPLPDDPGTPGEVLVKTETGTEWDAAPAAGVSSVNGDTGVVQLGAADVGADPAGSAAAAAAASLPVSQSFALANNAYKPIYLFTVTGQTDDPLPPFGQTSGSQTYSYPPDSGTDAVQGPAVWTGVNPRKLSGQGGLTPAESGYGSLGMAWFMDAGDSNDNAGGHGLEFTIGAFLSPDGTKATNSIEIVANNDNTNTVSTSFRCGNGMYTTPTGAKVFSGFSFTDAGGGSYLSMGPYAFSGNIPGINFSAPIIASNLTQFAATSPSAMSVQFTGVGAATYNFRSTTAASGFSVTADTAAASVSVNGNASAGSSGQFFFKKAGANKWTLEESGGVDFFVINNSGNPHMLLVSGVNTAGNYDLASTTLLTKTLNFGSFAVTNGGTALATTATTGFLGLPSVAGTPTGTPVAIAGSTPACIDPVAGKIWAYISGAWKSAALT